MDQYCLNCGHQLEKQIIENRDRDICPDCGWVNYVQLKVTAGVLVVQDSKLLLVQRAIDPWKGYWYLPAGYVESDENPVHAAEREAQEETGFEIHVKELVDIYFYNDDPRGNGLLILYYGRIKSGKMLISKETKAIKFFYPDEIRTLKLAGGSHSKAIDDYLTRVSKVDGK
jgi:ADP-ribose pyrophosphatase YjhB (NUDIX family)